MQSLEPGLRTTDQFCGFLLLFGVQEVFEKQHQHNSMVTWGLRAAGWALMFLGVSLTVRIVHTLGNATLPLINQHTRWVTQLCLS